MNEYYIHFLIEKYSRVSSSEFSNLNYEQVLIYRRLIINQ